MVAEDCLRVGKEAEVQNTVMDDRRADPQRVKRAFPTAGQTRAKERHESCGQHGRQEPCHHDREGHLNARVIVNVKGDEGFSDHMTSEPRASRTRQTAVLRTQQNSSG